MTIQRVVGLRTLRIRAQVALVLRQWEVAEENWIKTHELVEQKAAAPAKRLTRGRGPSAASVDGARASAAPEADARRSNANADARRTNSVPEVDVRSSTSNQSADGARANAVPEPDARKPAADGRREGRRSTIPLGSAKLPLGRTSVAEK